MSYPIRRGGLADKGVYLGVTAIIFGLCFI